MVGSNLNRYTYVLNNPLKYTDPSGYAYQGFGNSQLYGVSTSLINSNSQISQQVQDMEIRRKGFLSNLWGDVTLFDMIGDRGGAVSDINNLPTSVEWRHRVYGDADNNTVYHLYKVVNRGIEYKSSSLGNISLEELNYWWDGVKHGSGDWFNIANDINTGIGAGTSVFSGNYGLTAKNTFKYAQRINGKILSAAEIATAHTAHSLKVAKVLGNVSLFGGVVGTVVSVNKVITSYQKGGWNKVNGWDVSDALVGTGSVATGVFLATNPIGWGIAIFLGVYFGARLVYDLSNNP